jgi:hypothetical protein
MRGQAVLETALTLPLVIFLVLGAVQLFTLLQARVLAQYAAFKAVRAGSLSHGECTPMAHAAIAALLPTFAPVRSGAEVGPAFGARAQNRFNPSLDSGHDGAIVWLNRLSPSAGDIGGLEDERFDEPGRLSRLELQMVFWYPMRIPFANWVMARMWLAHFGLSDYSGVNPLMPVEKNAGWPDRPPRPFPNTAVAQELANRISRGQYTFPIVVNYGMRMMTPARVAHFPAPECPPAPRF